ncbi:MAG: galactose oxidase-like domain-containing protein [Pseudonocardiaceae bacterium]
MRRSLVPLAALALILGFTPFSAVAQPADPTVVGSFGLLFQEPTGIECTTAQDPAPRCKPGAVTVANLADGKQVYWNSLEGMNQVDFNVVAEYGQEAVNGQSRVLDLTGGGPQWTVPAPFDGGANPEGNDEENEYLPGGLYNNARITNDGDLFCSDVNFLPDGRLITNGGTAYYQEPGIPGDEGVGKFGVVELNGLKNTRIFDPKTQTWQQSGDMEFARWYPSMVTQPDGSQLTFGGVAKLIKPVYPERALDSGANERHVERFDPASGQWTTLPDSANKSLPLYPRLHLLPNGKVFYNAAGQTFNPAGYSYDEALWNFASVFDPQTRTWSDKGLPDFGGLPLGFRGSSFSVMLTLTPDEDGRYTTANFLSAGGVYGVTPGTYLATDTSTLTSIDTAAGDAMTSAATGKLNTPRWYGTGTMLPTGEVFVANGGDRDHVVAPGLDAPVRGTEIYDPDTGTWTPMIPQARGRTYHSSATLLPDGRVLVGGHAPIGTAYGKPDDTGERLLGLSKAYTDPTFQIFSPPYLHWGPRPVITNVNPRVRPGQVLDVGVGNPAEISSIRMLRNTSITHVVDSDQRNVELRIVGRDADSVQVLVPGNTVLPPGPYLLFAHRESERGEIPSVSRQVFVTSSP